MDIDALKNIWEGAADSVIGLRFDYESLVPGRFCIVLFDDHGDVYSVKPGFFESAQDGLAWLLYSELPSALEENDVVWVEARRHKLNELRAAMEAAIRDDDIGAEGLSSIQERFNGLLADASPRVQVMALGSLSDVLKSEYYEQHFEADLEDFAFDEGARPTLRLQGLLRSNAFDETDPKHLALARAFLKRHEVYND